MRKVPSELLNVLWGALCQTNTSKISATSETKVEINDSTITHFYSSDHQICIKHIKHSDNFFKAQWARIKPFVLGFARKQLYLVFYKFENLVVRAHTDGC